MVNCLNSLSRFLAVVFPVSSISLRTVPITRLAILVTWTVILASNVPVWMAHFTHEIENGMLWSLIWRWYYGVSSVFMQWYYINICIFLSLSLFRHKLSHLLNNLILLIHICMFHVIFVTSNFLGTAVCVFDVEHYRWAILAGFSLVNTGFLLVNTGLLLVNIGLLLAITLPSLVNILQPPGVPHQLLRDLIRSAHAADPDDVPGDAHKTLALLLLRHLQVITREGFAKYDAV